MEKMVLLNNWEIISHNIWKNIFNHIQIQNFNLFNFHINKDILCSNWDKAKNDWNSINTPNSKSTYQYWSGIEYLSQKFLHKKYFLSYIFFKFLGACSFF